MTKKKTKYVEGRAAFRNFDNAMGALLKVPHSQIKAELEAERKAKAESRSKRVDEGGER